MVDNNKCLSLSARDCMVSKLAVPCVCVWVLVFDEVVVVSRACAGVYEMKSVEQPDAFNIGGRQKVFHYHYAL